MNRQQTLTPSGLRRHTAWRRPIDYSRLVFVGLVGILTWAGREFATDDGQRLWFSMDAGPIGGEYVLTATVLALTLPAVLASGGAAIEPRLKEVGLRFWSLAALVVVGLHVAWALHSGAPFPFADWINLPFLAAVAWAAARWLSVQPWRRYALLDIAIAYGAFSLVRLILYAAGQGPTMFGVRTTMFSGGHLQMASFAAIVTFAAWLAGVQTRSRWYAHAIWIAFASSSLLVVLSFRRSHWMLWALGLILLFGFREARRRAVPQRLARVATVAALMLAVTVGTLGWQAITERLESFHPQSDSDFARTNQDHVNDVLDAMDVVAEYPVLGYGIGRFYETNRIWQWKAHSFDVHNAFVHVWLKFGIFGLLIALGLHIRWIVALGRVGAGGPGHTIFAATACFIAAELFVSLFGTWPYASFQMSMHRAFMLAGLLAVVEDLPTSRGR